MMMRNLLSVSLICGLLCWSCTSLQQGCRRTELRENHLLEWNGIVNPADGVNKFNLQVDIASHHFSGLLLVKQTPSRDCRMVFTTHFGMRVFDLEFAADSLYVHYCMEPVKKDKIIRLLKHDFSELLGREVSAPRRVYADRKTEGKKILVYEMEPSVCYLVNQEKNVIEKISAGRGWNKTYWQFEAYRTEFPDRIRIRHAVWPICIELSRLTCYNSDAL